MMHDIAHTPSVYGGGGTTASLLPRAPHCDMARRAGTALTLVLWAMAARWVQAAWAKTAGVLGAYCADKPSAMAAALRSSLNRIARTMSGTVGEEVEIGMQVVRSYDDAVAVLVDGRGIYAGDLAGFECLRRHDKVGYAARWEPSDADALRRAMRDPSDLSALEALRFDGVFEGDVWDHAMTREAIREDDRFFANSQ